MKGAAGDLEKAQAGFEAMNKAAAGAASGLEAANKMSGVLSYFPMQAGPPTEHCRSTRPWFFLILLMQATLIVLRVLFLQDIIGALWMAIMVVLGAYTVRHEMNITYMTAWGLLCAANCFFDILGFFLPFLLGVMSLQVLSTVVRVLIPISELGGALYAWHIYRDYQHNLGVNIDVLPAADPFGRLMSTHPDLDATKPFAGLRKKAYTESKDEDHEAAPVFQGDSDFKTELPSEPTHVAFGSHGEHLPDAGVPIRRHNGQCC